MKHVFLFLLLAVGWSVGAQTHCDGTRYIDYVFSEVDSTTGVQFGSNTTAAGFNKNLFMDVYYPDQEFFFARPVVLLAHGGSFIAGNRKNLRPICIDLARRGFVAATIDYRLYDALAQPIDSIVVMDIVVSAVSDMKAAIRYLKENAASTNEFGIDTNLLIIGGVSAGAVTALHCAYLDASDITNGSALDSVINANGGLKGNSSTNLNHTESALGVLNYSGGLMDADFIDLGDPTVFSVHDEFDSIVPYGATTTYTLGTPVYVEGSKVVHERALELGIRTQLITIEGSDQHVSYFLNGVTSDYLLVTDSSAIFLEYTVCDRISGQSDLAERSSVEVFPNPTASILNWKASQPFVSAKVYALSGQIQLEESIQSPSIIVDQLTPGVYVIELEQMDGKKFKSRFVVRP